MSFKVIGGNVSKIKKLKKPKKLSDEEFNKIIKDMRDSKTSKEMLKKYVDELILNDIALRVDIMELEANIKMLKLEKKAKKL